MVTTTLFVLGRGAVQEEENTGFLHTADLHLVVVPQGEHLSG